MTLLTAYRFVVEIDSKRIGAFTECALPTIQWDTQPIREGGLNSYVHQLPKGRRESQITLKRGLGVGKELVDWYQAAMSEKFHRKKITIMLLDSQLQTIYSWLVQDAYPVEWTGPQLQTDSKMVAVESLVLVCGEVTLEYGS